LLHGPTHYRVVVFSRSLSPPDGEAAADSLTMQRPSKLCIFQANTSLFWREKTLHILSADSHLGQGSILMFTGYQSNSLTIIFQIMKFFFVVVVVDRREVENVVDLKFDIVPLINARIFFSQKKIQCLDYDLDQF
jgi:hypothetical protein